MRSLIKPPIGYGIAYIDYTSQEIGIAAALSGDGKLKAAYSSGDPYLAFAKQVGQVPQDATKESHKAVRDRFKAVVLGVNYGMGAAALARRIGCLEIEAQELLLLHKQTYRKFWHWTQAVVDTALITGSISTVFGWLVHVGLDSNPRSLMNFPMQANGARIILVESASRFARDLAVQITGHELLQRRDIELVPVDAPDHFTNETPTAIMVRQILGAVSQFEKASLVEKLRKARERKRLETGRCEGRKPVPDVVVKEAKRLYRKSPRTGKRRSLRIIAKELAKLGYSAASGNPYGAESVKRMVSG